MVQVHALCLHLMAAKVPKNYLFILYFYGFLGVKGMYISTCISNTVRNILIYCVYTVQKSCPMVVKRSRHSQVVHRSISLEGFLISCFTS